MQINNLDTENITIDTYQMFNGESFEGNELDGFNEQNETLYTYDDFNWSYNHKKIVEDLANASIEILEHSIKYTEYADIIKSITYVSSGSPKFYNYTTDHYIMNIDFDPEKLQSYSDKNYKEIREKAENYDDTIINNLISVHSMQYASLCHILDNCISDDDYKMAMWEKENEIYSENTTITKK